MDKKNMGNALKESRERASLTVQQVSEILIAKGFKATKNTIYSWENNNSQPTPDALLELCILYHISNVLETFGYKSSGTSDSDALTITDEDDKPIINKFLQLTPRNKYRAEGVIDSYLAEQKADTEFAEELAVTEEPAVNEHMAILDKLFGEEKRPASKTYSAKESDAG